MKVVLQRVSDAQVTVEGEVVGSIEKGLCLFVGVGIGDTKSDVDYLTKKIPRLRIYPDDNGKMSRSVVDIGGQILVVSQFTLYGLCTKGCRPDFTRAAPPDVAESLYDYFLERMQEEVANPVQAGKFRQMMQVSLVNDGPVTLLLTSKS